jgi:hypothetical protein
MRRLDGCLQKLAHRLLELPILPREGEADVQGLEVTVPELRRDLLELPFGEGLRAPLLTTQETVEIAGDVRELRLALEGDIEKRECLGQIVQRPVQSECRERE